MTVTPKATSLDCVNDDQSKYTGNISSVFLHFETYSETFK